MKPELLLPVGNTESFFAAIEGGADAVYFGLKNFNARGRAKNFTVNQLQSILKQAEISKIKTYLTLNTLIKNEELSQLLDILFIISQTNISAIIIQDLGVYYLMQKFFPQLRIHASTQMMIHNSIGTNLFSKKGFERIILARELTFTELEQISKRTNVELEVFIHGALCYSFSGLCLFSSFLGGMSANRGLCKQPCRRIYTAENQKKCFFSMKDLQLIDILPQLLKLRISSLKIEGRMKSAEYVYRVAKAYRMAIDNPGKINEAKAILKYDFGRVKTIYFMGNDVSKAITENSYIGLLIGEIKDRSGNKFTFETGYPLSIGNRIRILPKSGINSKSIKIKEIERNKNKVTIFAENSFQVGDKIFLIGVAERKFRSKFIIKGKKLRLHLPVQKKKNILTKISSYKLLKNEELFIRINSLKWLKKIYFEKIDFLILNLKKDEWQQVNLRIPFLKKNLKKLILELPNFISEDNLYFYKTLLKSFYNEGLRNFILSHISQKNLLLNYKNIRMYSNENVYILNDAAIQFLKEENIFTYIYPQENDFSNLISGKDRKGIVPLFYYPQLFYSRMPVSFECKGNIETQSFNDRNEKYDKIIRDGITIIYPEKPVSLLQYKKKLFDNGFRRFLIDFSNTVPSGNTFNRVLKKFISSSVEQPSRVFNFKKGLQ
ncbi:MAG: hypothetical protein DRJ01_17255 [Bacteroidetes bacterium]|nr:MAG: hypothetical protein DRJ01_17255 [Bacteroidota bacterium]